jgi:hypothetical protein
MPVDSDMQAIFDSRDGVSKRVAPADNNHTTAADEAEAAEEATLRHKNITYHDTKFHH